MEEGDLGKASDGFRNDDVKLGLGEHFNTAVGVEGEELGLHTNESKQGCNFDDAESSSATSLNSEQDPDNKQAKVESVNLGSGPDNENDIHCVAPVHEGINENISNSGGAEENACNNNDNLLLGDLLVDWMDLPTDLLLEVLSFVDHIGLCKAACVCKQWKNASSYADFWRYLNFENRPISEEQFKDMCHRFSKATAVNVYGTRAIHSFGINSVSLLSNLTVLTLGKGLLHEAFFEALTDCHTLRSLTINDATLDSGIQGVPIHHAELCNLQIINCELLHVSISCPQLNTLSLKHSSMPTAILNCPLLRVLDIASCRNLLDDAIRSSAMSSPLLESLDMSSCYRVSDETLQGIALSCGNLHVLDASYCPRISLESVTLPMLTVLKLHGCERITSDSMADVARSPMLEVLELDNCSFFTSVSLDLPCLQRISLVNCHKFVDLNLRSNALSSVTVSKCPLQIVTIASSALKQLVLQKQRSLTILTLQCHGLQEVDLTESESLTNSVNGVFSTGGCCTALRSLVLDRCESLTEVSFCSPSLVSLSLGGCHAITSLDLSCRYLEHLSLVGCDHLERAKFSPVGLKSLNLGICPRLSALYIEAPEMVSLELKGCGALFEAVIRCPILTSLDASFCSQLKDRCLSTSASSSPLIESLILMSCTSIGRNGLLSLSCLWNLTFLDISHTYLIDLQPVFDSCVYLKVLKLQACKYLSDSSLEPLNKHNALPYLCELDLSYGKLCRSAIEELLACRRHLTHLSLNGCVNMHDLDWSFQMEKSTLASSFNDSSLESIEEQGDRLLQSLNCVGCPNIKKVVIPPTARCFHLTLLNLSLSPNLKEVDLSCCNLITLMLSCCDALEILKLDCPRLINLYLQFSGIGEEAVETAVRQCNKLQTLDIRSCQKISPSSIRTLRATCSSLKRIFQSAVLVDPLECKEIF